MTLLVPVPHLRQPETPTTPTQQHLPLTHFATRHHTSPNTTSDGDTITIVTTIYLFPHSIIRHLSSTTPYTSQPPTTHTSFTRLAPVTTAITQKCITWAPSITGGIAPIATYQTAAINPGQRRRRATTAQKNSADRAAFLSASITIHPGIKSHTWCKRSSDSCRSHRRRV
jgi:hypothetical protein